MVCIGIDLDNTIICYDRVFERLARTNQLDGRSRWSKNALKSEVEKRGGADAWTAMQAEIYGPGLDDADLFPGVLAFLQKCRRARSSIRIISLKTRFPALGPRYDLRRAALSWLESHGIFDDAVGGLTPDCIEFHDSLPAKVDAIAARTCDVFVDDLLEVFLSPKFPRATRRILFDPSSTYSERPGIVRASSWKEISRVA